MHKTWAYDASIFNFNDLLVKWLEEMFLPVYVAHGSNRIRARRIDK